MTLASDELSRLFTGTTRLSIPTIEGIVFVKLKFKIGTVPFKLSLFTELQFELGGVGCQLPPWEFTRLSTSSGSRLSTCLLFPTLSIFRCVSPPAVLLFSSSFNLLYSSLSLLLSDLDLYIFHGFFSHLNSIYVHFL